MGRRRGAARLHGKDRKLIVVSRRKPTRCDSSSNAIWNSAVSTSYADLRAAVVTQTANRCRTAEPSAASRSRGPAGPLLRNRFYIGEVRLIAADLPRRAARNPGAEAVRRGPGCSTSHGQSRDEAFISEPPLTGRIFDDRGNRMTPTYATKKGVRYRYYVSSALFHGQKREAGRLPSGYPAAEIESLIAQAIRARLQITSDAACDRELIDHVSRVDVALDNLKVTLNDCPRDRGSKDSSERARFSSLGRRRRRDNREKSFRPLRQSLNGTDGRSGRRRARSSSQQLPRGAAGSMNSSPAPSPVSNRSRPRELFDPTGEHDDLADVLGAHFSSCLGWRADCPVASRRQPPRCAARLVAPARDAGAGFLARIQGDVGRNPPIHLGREPINIRLTNARCPLCPDSDRCRVAT